MAGLNVRIIVYSAATSRVRRWVNPENDYPSVVSFINQAHAGAGEAALVYTMKGGGQDTLAALQAAVTAHTGVTPAGDWMVAVDANNGIRHCGYFDLLCGDNYSGEGWTLVPAPEGVDISWTFTPPNIFTPPVFATPIKLG